MTVTCQTLDPVRCVAFDEWLKCVVSTGVVPTAPCWDMKLNRNLNVPIGVSASHRMRPGSAFGVPGATASFSRLKNLNFTSEGRYWNVDLRIAGCGEIAFKVGSCVWNIVYEYFCIKKFKG